MQSRGNINVRDYYEKNKEWLHEIAQSGDPIIRAMALAVLEVAGAKRVEGIEQEL